jgi:hypothetical protein
MPPEFGKGYLSSTLTKETPMKNKSRKPHSKNKTAPANVVRTNATVDRVMRQPWDKDVLRKAFNIFGAVKGVSLRQKAIGHQKAGAVTARYYSVSPESEWARQLMKLTPKTVLGDLYRPLLLSQMPKRAKPKNSKSKKSKPKSKNK